VPEAWNCCEAPRKIEGFTGVTAIELRPWKVPFPESAIV
jgi:hypothetical protein